MKYLSTEQSLLTPLHLAANEKNYFIVEHLIENGADPFAKDVNGRRPLDLCIGENYLMKYFRLKEKEIIKKHLRNLKFNASSIKIKRTNEKNLKAHTFKKKNIMIEMQEDYDANVEEEESLAISLIQNTLPKTKKNLESHKKYIFFKILHSLL